MNNNNNNNTYYNSNKEYNQNLEQIRAEIKQDTGSDIDFNTIDRSSTASLLISILIIIAILFVCGYFLSQNYETKTPDDLLKEQVLKIIKDGHITMEEETKTISLENLYLGIYGDSIAGFNETNQFQCFGTVTITKDEVWEYIVDTTKACTDFN